MDGDNQLWLRTLVVAKLVRQFGEDAEMAFETPEDRWRYKEHGDHPSLSFWPEVTGTLEEELGLKRVHLNHTILWSAWLKSRGLMGCEMNV